MQPFHYPELFGMAKRIIFTVTNDLTYDQRMHRICRTLADAGIDVLLTGRKRKDSVPLKQEKFRQKRIRCWFTRGKWFYAEYNIRLFIFLLFRKSDVICAIDLDSILPCLYVSRLKQVRRVYDAHELFTGLKEVVTRPSVYNTWMRIEKKTVPRFPHGYTVCESIAEELKRRYGVQYETIRNVPMWQPVNPVLQTEKIVVYSGAVNEARAFESLIPALKEIDAKLLICGTGNFMVQLKKLIADHQVAEKIELKGMLQPDALWQVLHSAKIGVALAENNGLNQYYALPNKFFDYIQAGLPQVTMNFPEYRKINEVYRVAILIDEPDPSKIAEAVNKLLNDDVLYRELQQNCLKAAEVLCWEQEEKKLLAFYQKIFSE